MTIKPRHVCESVLLDSRSLFPPAFIPELMAVIKEGGDGAMFISPPSNALHTQVSLISALFTLRFIGHAFTSHDKLLDSLFRLLHLSARVHA